VTSARDLVTVTEETDQEAVAHLLVDGGLLAIPVVDADGRMKGVVTADDVVDVVQEEATEDIQKIGGSEALDEPYLQIGLTDMVRKRGRWLAALFLGEMLTATAMGFFEGDRSGRDPGAVRAAHHRGGNSAAGATLSSKRPERGAPADWWRVAHARFHRSGPRFAAGPDRPGADPCGRRSAGSTASTTCSWR
jgi:magnesium transporter